MKLREIKREVHSLSPKELIRLEVWLRDLIAAAEAERRARAATRRGVNRGPKLTHKTYRLERVRCGKQNCKCHTGEMHGPYWYAYWTEGGKTKSQYVGKERHEPEQSS